MQLPARAVEERAGARGGMWLVMLRGCVSRAARSTQHAQHAAPTDTGTGTGARPDPDPDPDPGPLQASSTNHTASCREERRPVSTVSTLSTP